MIARSLSWLTRGGEHHLLCDLWIWIGTSEPGISLDVHRLVRRLTNLPPLTQASIIAEVRPERDPAGAFSFLAPGGNGATHPHISRANQRMRPMMRISSAVRS